jgi:ribosomal protein L22
MAFTLPRLPTSARALLGAVSLAFAALGSVGSVGCGEPEPVKKGPSTAAEPGEQAKIEAGRKKIDDAGRAMNEKKYDRARKLLTEASELAIESQRFEIETAVDKLDKREAKLWANEVADKFKDKDCDGAFKQLEAPIKSHESETFTRELRRQVGGDALKCIQAVTDDKVLAATYGEARKLVDTPEAKVVLGLAGWKKLVAELDATLLDAFKGQIADELKARKWSAAVDKIDALAKKGDATPEQAAALIEVVRAGVGPEIAQASQKALGQNDAPKTLREVDALIKLAKWEVMAPDAAALSPDKALPAEIAKKREALAIWVEASHVAMKILKKPEKRWAHGRIPVFPATKVDGESKRDLGHGTELWILGTAKGRALITDTDPGTGPLTAMLEKATGWVPVEHLATEATIDWLVPDDQLKGQRVWGPLRKDEPTLELGIVAEASGKEITVKRVADDAPIKVVRKQLRNGRLAPGTKVITFCTAKDMPAQIIETPLDKTVKLKCDGGQEKEEVLASLRSKPDLLPASK